MCKQQKMLERMNDREMNKAVTVLNRNSWANSKKEKKESDKHNGRWRDMRKKNVLFKKGDEII